MHLLGLIGKAGVGKNTFAKPFIAAGWMQMGLADPMKRACAEWFDWAPMRLWGASELREQPDERYGGLTPRRALQLLGTEFGRQAYEDLWVKMLLRNVHTLEEGPPCMRPKGVIVTDVRFKNEVALLASNDFKLAQIWRPMGDVNTQYSRHISETELEDIEPSYLDYVIPNNGTEEHLIEKASAVLEDFEEGRHEGDHK